MKLGRPYLFLWCVTSLVLGATPFIQNSPFTQLSFDPFTHSLQLWKQSHTLQKAIKTQPSDLISALQSAGFKAVSADVDDDILFLIQETRFSQSLGTQLIKGGAYSHLLSPPPLTLKPFSTRGSDQELFNTTDITLAWQNDAPADIAYQQLLKQHGEGWDIVSTNIHNKVTSMNIVEGAGTYVVRKILLSNDYLDSDGESSAGDLSSLAKAKIISIDLTPPDFVSGCIVSYIGSQYRWRFEVAECVQLELTLKNSSDIVVYHVSQIAPAGPLFLAWNGENQKGNKSDGRYTYALTLMDTIGNRSPPVTGDLIIDSTPPQIVWNRELSLRPFSPNHDGIKDTLTCDLRFSEPVRYTLTLLDSAGQSVTQTTRAFGLTTDEVILAEAGQTVVVTAFDGAGLNTCVSFSILADITPPHITTLNDVYLTQQEPTIHYPFVASEVASLQIVLGAKVVTQDILTGRGQIDIEASTLADGRYVGHILLTDRAGNETRQTFNVVVNNGAPSLILSHFPTELSTETLVTFSYSIGESLFDESSIELSLYLKDDNASPYRLGSSYAPHQTISLDANLLGQALAQNGLITLLLKLSINGQSTLEQTQTLNVALYPALIDLSDFGHLTFTGSDGRFASLKQVQIDLLDISGNTLTTLLNSSNVNGGEQRLSLPNTLSDGTYQLSVDALSWGGKHTRKTSRYILDHTPPTIMDTTLLGNPNNYSRPWGIAITLADALAIKAVELSLMGEIVASQSIVNPLACVLTFDARVDGKKLPDGHYGLDLSISDLANNVATQSVSFDIDTLAPTLISSSVWPTLFAPGNDDADQSTAIALTSNEPAASTLYIYNATNALVRTLRDTNYSCYSHMVWDGYAQDYSLKDGRYRLILELTDAAGNVTRCSLNTVEIARSRQTLSGLRLSPNKISSGKTLTLQFVNAITGNLIIAAYNLEGRSVKTILSGNVFTREYTLTWDTLSDQGTLLDDGDYVLGFDFVSLDKSTKKTFKLLLSINNLAPAVYDYRLNSSYFTRSSLANLQVSFKLFETVSCNIGLFNPDKTLLQTLQGAQRASGVHKINLDMISANLALGAYYIGTRFTDEVGNTAQSFASLNLVNECTPDILCDKTMYIFTPDGDALNETISPKLTVTGVGRKTIRVSIKTDTGKEVITLAQLDRHEPANVDLEWNGKNTDGVAVPEGLYYLVAHEQDELGQQKTIEIPIALITQKITLQTQDNGSLFSFNRDGRQDSLAYALRLQFPEPIADLTDYKGGADLHLQIWQADTLLSDKTVSLIDKYEGIIDDSLVPHEGPFRIKLFGENKDGLSIATTTLNYQNDLTPPQAGTLDALVESALMIADTADPRLRIKTLFNVLTVDAIVEGADAVLANVSSEKGFLFTASGNNGVYYLRQIVGTEGLNRLVYQLVDGAGNLALTQSVAYTIDLTPPDIVSVEVGHYAKAGTYPITVNVSEPLASVPSLSLLCGENRLTVRPLRVSGNRFTGQFSVVSQSVNGAYRLLAENLTDLAGNVTTITLSPNITVDTIAPNKPTLGTTSPLLNTSSVVLQLSAEQESSIDLTLDGDFIRRLNAGPITLNLLEGAHRLSAIAIDKAGNESDMTTLDATIDLTPPRIINASIENKEHLKSGTYSLSLTFNETLRSLGDIFLDTAMGLIPVIDYQLTIPDLLNATADLVVLSATDLADNIIDLRVEHFVTLDNTPPPAPELVNKRTHWNTLVLTNTVLTEPDSQLWVTFDSETATTLDAHFSQPLNEGVHSLALVAIDRAGNRSTPTTLDIRMDITLPELIGFEVPPYLKTGTYPITLNLSEVILTIDKVSLRARDKRRTLPVVGLVISNDQATGWVDIASGDDNTYDLWVEGFSDSAGNINSAIAPTVCVVDTIPPESLCPELSHTGSNWLKAGTYRYPVHFSEPIISVGAVYLETLDHVGRIDLSELVFTSHDMSARLDVLVASNTTYKLVIADVVDLAHNSTTLVLSADIIIDTTPPPAPTLVDFAPLINTQSVILRLSAEADSTTSLYLDGQTFSKNLSPNVTITLSLNEGFHYIALQSVDRAGNGSIIQNDSVTIDLTPAHVVTWSIEGLTALKAATYTVTLGFSEPIVSLGSVALESLDKASRYPVSDSGLLTIIPQQDGVYDLIVPDIRDVAGNLSSVVISAAVVVDTTPPDAPQFASFPALINTQNVKLRFVTEEQALLELVVDEEARPALYHAHDDGQLTLAEGQHHLSLVASDTAGNRSATQDYVLTVDLTPPAVTQVGLGGREYLKAGTYAISVDLTESIISVASVYLERADKSCRYVASELRLEGQTLFATLTISPQKDGGVDLILLGVSDRASNTVNLRMAHCVTIDTLAPLAPQYLNLPTLTNRPTFNAQIETEPDTNVEVYSDGVLYTNTALSEGDHRLDLIAYDRACNQSPIATYALRVDLTKPTLKSISFTAVVSANSYPLDLVFSEPLNWSQSPNIRLLTLSEFRELPVIAALNQACRVQATLTTGENGPSQLFISGLIDPAGNLLDSVITQAFTIDTTPPQLLAINRVSTAPVKDGRLELTATFSEPVSFDALLALAGSTLNATINQPTISVIIPKNIQGQATLWFCHVTDRVGNRLSDFNPLTLPVDAIAPTLLDSPRFIVSTNRGSLSKGSVSINMSEPIKTDTLELSLLVGNKIYAPDRVIFSADRKGLEAFFELDALEENANLRITHLVDDFDNTAPTIVQALGRIDNVAPHIAGFGADVSRFSAIKNRGSDAAIHITFNSHEDYTKCYVRIYDRAGSLRKTLKDTLGSAGTTLLDPWNGKDDNGNYLTKGWYTLKIWAIDEAGNEGIPTSGLFEITEQRVTLSVDTKPAPYSFIASGPRSFPYSFSEIILTANEPRPDGIRLMDIDAAPPIGKITEAIYLGTGNILVALLTLNALAPIMVDESLGSWDGQISGNWATSGLYTFRVTGAGLNSDTYLAMAETSFVVDHDPPVLSLVTANRRSVSTQPFSFNDLNVHFAAVDNSGLTINMQLMLNDIELSRGSNVSELCANFINNDYLDGDYTLTLRAFDSAHNSSRVDIPIILDSTPPNATFQTVSNNGFVSTSVQIINLTVPNESSYTVAYQFGTQVTQNPSIDSTSLNGRLLVGLTLSDNAGNRTQYATFVTVDNQIEPPRFTLPCFTATRTVSLNNFSHAEPYLDKILVRQINAGQATAWQSWTPDERVRLLGNDGRVTLEMKITDMAGNGSTPWTGSTVLDTTQPVITAVAPANYFAFDNGRYAYDHVSNITANWVMTVDNEPNGLDAYIFSPSTLRENTNNVTIQAIDRAGNIGAAYGPIPIIIDNLAPSMTLVNTAAGRWVNGQSDDELRLSIEENYPSYNVVRITNANGVIVTSSNTLALKDILKYYSSGEYDLAITAYDLVGHGSNTVTTMCYLDKEAPILHLLAMDTVVNRCATLSITATDTGGSELCQYLIRYDQKQIVTQSSTIVIPFEDIFIGQSKALSIDIFALDFAGNTSNCLSKGLLIDKVAPIVKLAFNDAKGTYISRGKPTLSLNVTAHDEDSGLNELFVRYQSEWTLYTLGQDLSPYRLGYDLADGAYPLGLSVIDRAGNTAIASINYIIDNTKPVITEFAINPRAINRKNPVSISLVCDTPLIDTAYVSITTQNQANRFVTLNIPLGDDFAPIVRTYLLNAISTLNPNVRLTDKTYTVFIKLNDYANNISDIRSALFTLDTIPPQISHLASIPTVHASLDPDTITNKPIVLTYNVTETNTLTTHRVRLFACDFNSNLMDIDRLAESAAPINQVDTSFSFKWDGWIRLGDNPNNSLLQAGRIRQLPEGIYFIELTLEDEAGNKTTTVTVMTLENDIWIGGNTPHFPSVETGNTNEVLIRYGEGGRYETSVEVRGSGFGQAWVDDRLPFTLDLPQTVYYSEINANDKIYDGTSHRAMDYLGGINNNGTVLSSLYLDTSNPWRAAPSGYYNLVVRFQGNALDVWVIVHIVNTAWRTDRVKYSRYPTYVNTTIFNGDKSTNTSTGIVPLKNANNADSQSLHRRSVGLVGYLYQDPATQQYSFSPSISATQKLVKNIFYNKAGNATNISSIVVNHIRHTAWEDDRSGQNQIYYQRTYNDYAFSDLSPTQQIVALSIPSIDIVTSFNLLSPKFSNGAPPILATTRPTFVWTIPSNKLQANSHFLIELFKGLVAGNDGLVTFDVPLNTLDDHYQHIVVPAGTYKQQGNQLDFTPDIFNNLGATAANECYRWQVAADWNNDGLIEDISLTSEVFKLAPPLDISYTLNYPNPFKTSTHIRYKLSKDAQSVTIKIYNLNGKVVRTLTDCPTTGTRPYHEYHDVRWDGCNEVGDEALNGVYIYKIVAVDEGHTQASATGKLLKLK